MHIQPHSDKLRRYIAPDTYFSLTEEQRRRSFIGMNLSFSNETVILNRINQLEQLEEKGFVFFGEKNWLTSFLSSSRPSDMEGYDQWVTKNFREYLRLPFEISTEHTEPDTLLWCAELDTIDLLLGYADLKNPGFLEIAEMEIIIAGNTESPHPSHLIKAFEFLHDLEYAISTVRYQPKGGREISVTGIEITNPIDPSRWELNVISDYGSEWDFTMVNGRAWRS